MPVRITDEELQRQIEHARTSGRRARHTLPRAVSARYDAARAMVEIGLESGASLSFPPNLAQGLRGASEEDLSDITILGGGTGVAWDRLEADFTVAGLLKGIFGSERWMRESASS
jgi:hypothetical protein